MHHFRTSTAGYAGRGLSLLVAYILLVQSVFVSCLATQHALAAAAPDFTFALCASHENTGGTPDKAPSPHHFVPCAICAASASAAGILPEAPLPLAHLESRRIAPQFALAAVHFPEAPSPRRSQGPPLTA